MVTRCCIVLCATNLLAACSYNEQLQPGAICHQNVSRQDIREIRTLLLGRPDIRKPLWGLTCDERGRLVAESGGNHRGDNIGSFVTLARKDGKWQIIKIKEGPVMVVEVSSILSGTTEHLGDTPVRPNQSLQPTAPPGH